MIAPELSELDDEWREYRIAELISFDETINIPKYLYHLVQVENDIEAPKIPRLSKLTTLLTALSHSIASVDSVFSQVIFTKKLAVNNRLTS